jgi:RNA polymerase sigma-70 factor (ECF subfamily)
VDRTPAAARQLASRARRRVQGTAPVPERDLARQRAVVEAFLAAARDGDFDALLALLDPDVVLRADTGELREVRGAAAVLGQITGYRRFADSGRLALVNGAAGLVTLPELPSGRPMSVMGLTVAEGRIVAIDILADPARLAGLDLAFLDR